jgi:hypothetical protein
LQLLVDNREKKAMIDFAIIIVMDFVSWIFGSFLVQALCIIACFLIVALIHPQLTRMGQVGRLITFVFLDASDS